MDFDDSARSWNTHTLLTRAALRSLAEPRLDEFVEVVGIGEFLSRAVRDFTRIMERYNRRISLRAGIPVPDDDQASHLSTDIQFLKALKLNPTFKIRHARAFSRNEVSADVLHDPSRSGPPGSMYTDVFEGETIKGREILTTYSDEPDWGMDQDLYPIEEYGYGPAPFGIETGASSQAPFHMAFLHENPILTAAVPDLRRSFMEERIRVFFALARAAFSNGVEYWGWRFTAWAMHYLQDLTQPYHAKPFPPPVWPVLKSLAKSRVPKGFLRKHKNYLKNRHTLFEAVVHFILNEASKKAAEHPFFEALQGPGEISEKPIARIMFETSRLPARIATTVDSVMINLIDHTRMGDPDYLLEEDSGFRIEQEMLKASMKRPELLGRFIRIVSDCLLETGKVTRFAVRTACCGESKDESFL